MQDIIKMHQAPLIFLCEHSTAVEPVRAFLEDNQVEVRDELAFVAHYACRNKTDAALPIINMLRGVEYSPKGKKRKGAHDLQGNVHKKQLILTGDEPSTIFCIAEGTQQHLPLHTAALLQKSSRSAEVVRAVIQAYPAGLLMHDVHGRLPLELACQNSLRVARVLMQAQPIIRGSSQQVMALYCEALSDESRCLVRALLMVQRRPCPRLGSNCVGLDSLPWEVVLIIIKHLCARLIAGGRLDRIAAFATQLSSAILSGSLRKFD